MQPRRGRAAASPGSWRPPGPWSPRTPSGSRHGDATHSTSTEPLQGSLLTGLGVPQRPREALAALGIPGLHDASPVGLSDCSPPSALGPVLDFLRISVPSASHQRPISVPSASHQRPISVPSASHQRLISVSSASHQRLISVSSASHQRLISVSSASHQRLISGSPQVGEAVRSGTRGHCPGLQQKPRRRGSAPSPLL
jgi:hypothetical protein